MTDLEQTAKAQCQSRFPGESESAFEVRVMGVHAARKRNKHVTEWRKDNSERYIRPRAMTYIRDLF
jgi:hypothetical protein